MMVLNRKKGLTLCIVLAYFLSIIYSQGKYPQDYFRSPLDIPLYISGNFGEIRNDHFHSGIDIKTQGAEGKNVYAVADGYISRIKIETGGYGRALYVTHPNGYVSVYAHLKEFNNLIKAYVKNEQYSRKVHTLDIYPEKTLLPVTQGDIIALSGNSGRSFGAHLHFEIRDALTQFPLNVLLFNLDIKDNVKPVIATLVIYPIGPCSFVNKSDEKAFFTITGANGNYSLDNKYLIQLSGDIGIGLESYDYLDVVNNPCGIYSMQLFVDSNLVYFHQMERISFWETRYINSFIDYEARIKTGKNIQKAYVDPNNKLSIYKEKVNRGIYNFSDNDTHTIKLIVKDVYNNSTKLEFDAVSLVPSPIMNNPMDTNFIQTLYYNSANSFEQHDIEIHFPTGSFYDNINFTYAKTQPLEGCYSWTHYLHNIYTPVHKYYTLKIKPDSLPAKYMDKALIVQVNDDHTLSSIGGNWEKGFVVSKSRSFGKFTVTIDTMAPLITPLNIMNKADMTSTGSIDFKVTDNLSGIKSYNGYIDHKWVLFEYDEKNDLITYTFDPERLQKGKQHSLALYISDEKNNINKYTCTFIW